MQAEIVAQTKPVQEQPTAPVWVQEPVEGDPQMEELAHLDLAALRQVNPDVIGWKRQL